MSATAPELPFRLAEYEARIERTRAALRARGLGALLVGTGANLTYLTRYPSPPASPSRPFRFVLPVDADPCVSRRSARA
jgi:Xaa-Pro aminopeptidase